MLGDTLSLLFFEALIFLFLWHPHWFVEKVTTQLKGVTCLFHVFAKLCKTVFGIRKTFRSVAWKRGPSVVMFLIPGISCHCIQEPNLYSRNTKWPRSKGINVAMRKWLDFLTSNLFFHKNLIGDVKNNFSKYRGRISFHQRTGILLP